MTNYDLSLKVFDFLNQAKVKSVVVCAGARNAPLVMALQGQNFKVYTFFEERSASFFALGLMRAHSLPVAVITTSGTAVAELLPAAIEATYQGLPLIIVSADRPKSYRGTGSPQTIEQVGLFSNYVESTYDIDIYQEEFKFDWSFKKPIHLNVSFDEPLIDERSTDYEKFRVQLNKVLKYQDQAAFSKVNRKPLIIVGGLEGADVPEVIKFIESMQVPVYAEATSQLAHVDRISEFMIRAGDIVVKKIFQDKICDSVIRIGTVPTLRFWRELEIEFIEIPVMQFSNLHFSGLSRPSAVLPMADLNEIQIDCDDNHLQDVQMVDQQLQKQKLKLIEKFPQSEPALVAALSEVIAYQPLYLGNSLPIRHWDQFASAASMAVYANRGANGIDGQVSTYLGWSEAFTQSFCLVGDLTAMYDLASLGLASQLRPGKKRVIIINNFGGQIFGRIFRNDLFINSHQTQFKHWAAMWNWDYQLAKNKDDLQEMNGDHLVLEIQPDAHQTKLFWDEWDQLCRRA